MIPPVVALIAVQSSRLQIGTSWSGEEVLHFHSKPAEIDETHRFKLTYHVYGKQEGMWMVERKSTLLGTRMGDTELPPPPYRDPSAVNEWLSPAGFLLDLQPFDPGEFALDRLLHFWLPANNPDEWSADLETSVNHAASKARASLKAVGRRGGPSEEYALTVESLDEPPGLTATGTMWFDLSTGRLLSARIEAKNARLPGSRETSGVTVSYTDSLVKH